MYSFEIGPSDSVLFDDFLMHVDLNQSFNYTIRITIHSIQQSIVGDFSRAENSSDVRYISNFEMLESRDRVRKIQRFFQKKPDLSTLNRWTFD